MGILKDFGKSALNSTKQLASTIGRNLVNIPKSIGKGLVMPTATLANEAGITNTSLGAKKTRGTNLSHDQKTAVINKNAGDAAVNAGAVASTLTGGIGSAAGRVAYAAVPGALIGGGSELQRNKPENIGRSAFSGAVMSVATAGILEGFGYLLKTAAKSKNAQDSAEDVYNKEYTGHNRTEKLKLDAATKRQSRSDVLEISDDQVQAESAMANTLGYKMKKYGFQGTDKEILKQSSYTVKKDGAALDAILAEKNMVRVSKLAIKERILADLTSDGTQPLTHPKTTEAQINALLRKDDYSPLELNALKREAYKLIDPKNWASGGKVSAQTDAQMAIASQSNKLINELVPDPKVQLLNDRMGAALAAENIAAMKISTKRVGGSKLSAAVSRGTAGQRTLMGTAESALLWIPRKVFGSQKFSTSVAQLIDSIANPSNVPLKVQLPQSNLSSMMSWSGKNAVSGLIPAAASFPPVNDTEQLVPGNNQQEVSFNPSDFGAVEVGASAAIKGSVNFNPQEFGATEVK